MSVEAEMGEGRKMKVGISIGGALLNLAIPLVILIPVLLVFSVLWLGTIITTIMTLIPWCLALFFSIFINNTKFILPSAIIIGVILWALPLWGIVSALAKIPLIGGFLVGLVALPDLIFLPAYIIAAWIMVAFLIFIKAIISGG